MLPQPCKELLTLLLSVNCGGNPHGYVQAGMQGWDVLFGKHRIRARVFIAA